MIADLKPYPGYKDSGVPWLGKVPEQWDVRRARYIAREVDNRSATGTETHLSMSQRLGLVPSSEVEERRLVSESYAGAKLCEPDDLVLNRLKAHLGVFALARQSGLVSPDYTVFRRASAHVLMRFFEPLLKSPACRGELRTRSKGLVEGFWRLYTDDFYAIRLPVPPVSEQSAIVRFLDHADRRIRRYIHAKQKLINLLNEQKQAIIHRAVTRGLDPKVCFKPSGVEWLGDVPEHWELRRLKSLVRRIDQGVSPQAENYLAAGDAWGVLKAGCVNRGVFKESEHKRLPKSFAFDPILRVKMGDVLVSRASGSPHLVGSVGRVPSLEYKLILSDKTFRPVFTAYVDPDFMVLAMNSRYYRQQVQQAISGAEGLANNLPLSSLRAFLFVIPPAEEQRSIIDYLRKTTEGLLATVARTDNQIALLREYRTRLIADVVTGKLDVRAAAAQLPDEPEQPEVTDETEALDEKNQVEETDLDTGAVEP